MSQPFILAPLLSLIFLNLPLGKPMKKAAFWLLALLCCAQVAAVAGYSFGLLPGARPDRAAGVVLLSAGLIAAASLLTAKALIRDEGKLFDYINLLLVSLTGLNGVALAQDIFSLYVFIEVTAVATFILIAFLKDKPGLEAAFKYVILSSAASVMMLTAVALLMMISGGTGFAVLRQAPRSALSFSAVALFICGAFIKGGLVPFHGWLPEVYSSAPAPVSVLLAGVVTKALGAFVVVRLAVSVFDPAGPLGQAVMFIGALSIVAAAFAAFAQNDLKRLLAFSSISQMGYIVLGAGAGNALGLAGALLHLFNHAVFKSTLFINAAAVEDRTATREMNRLGGLSSRMPVTAVTAAISWLSCAGIPPLAGFWSKLLIIVALWVSGHYAYAVIAAAASGLTLGYFLSMQRQVFQGNVKEEFSSVKEAAPELLLPACALSAISVGLGLAFPFWLSLLK